jgi:hypothetical protein
MIIVALDIDDTMIDRIGNYIGSHDEWHATLTELQRYGERYNIPVVFQLVTAKQTQTVDCTIDKILAELPEFFPTMTSTGAKVSTRGKHQYLAKRHINESLLFEAYNNFDKRVFNRAHSSDKPLPIKDEEYDLLPAVHIVHSNYRDSDDNLQTSKSHVLKYIADFLGVVDPKNVFLFDDSEFNRSNLEHRFGDPSVPEFQFILSGSLASLSASIKARIDTIVAPSLASEPAPAPALASEPAPAPALAYEAASAPAPDPAIAYVPAPIETTIVQPSYYCQSWFSFLTTASPPEIAPILPVDDRDDEEEVIISMTCAIS